MRKTIFKNAKIVTFVSVFMIIILVMLPIFSIESMAANKYGTFKGNAPDTYSVKGNAVYFYPKKIYYSGKKVVCYVYVVNKTGKKIVGLSNVKLTLRDEKKKTVAEHTFKKKIDVTIRKDKYKTLKFVFPASSVKKKKFNFGKAKKMSIRSSYVFYRP